VIHGRQRGSLGRNYMQFLKTASYHGISSEVTQRESDTSGRTLPDNQSAVEAGSQAAEAWKFTDLPLTICNRVDNPDIFLNILSGLERAFPYSC